MGPKFEETVLSMLTTVHTQTVKYDGSGSALTDRIDVCLQLLNPMWLIIVIRRA